MKNELRAVVDANVLISAELLPRSIPRQAVDLTVQDGRILFSEATLGELDEVLRRPKFDKYVSEQGRLEFLASLLDEAEIVPISQKIVECRDPKDNRILELALSGQASDVVTGDADLLALHPFGGVDILLPQAYLDKCRSGGNASEPLPNSDEMAAPPPNRRRRGGVCGIDTRWGERLPF